MTFSRDDLAAYEAAKPAPVSADPETPVETKPTEDSSAEVVTEPADLVEDGSKVEDVIAESSTATAEDPEGDTQEDKPKGSAARERIEELIIERNAVRKYAEYMLAEVERLKSANAPNPKDPVSADAESVEDKQPTLEDHGYDPVAFAAAQNSWMKRQIAKEVKAGVKEALAQVTTQQQQQQIRDAFNARVTEFKKAHSDFDTVISNPSLPNLNDRTAGLIVKSESGPAIAYHLAKNPDLAARIARLEGEAQAMAIGRLEAQLLATAPTSKTSTQRTVSKAPPPPKPVSSGASIAKNVADMSMDEFVAHEREQKIKERQNRRQARSAMR